MRTPIDAAAGPHVPPRCGGSAAGLSGTSAFASGHVDVETLSAFFDGELDGPARCYVAEHVSRCQRCVAALHAFREIRRLLNSAAADGGTGPVPDES